MKSAASVLPADLTAAALNLPRSARLRIVSALLEKEGDQEAADDYEAAARAAECEEAPERFLAKGSPRVFLAKVRRELEGRARAGKVRKRVLAA